MVEPLQDEIIELHTKLNTWQDRHYLAREELSDFLREIIWSSKINFFIFWRW